MSAISKTITVAGKLLPRHTDSNGLSGGAIVGIVVGCVVSLLLVAALILSCSRRRSISGYPPSVPNNFRPQRPCSTGPAATLAGLEGNYPTAPSSYKGHLPDSIKNADYIYQNSQHYPSAGGYNGPGPLYPDRFLQGSDHPGVSPWDVEYAPNPVIFSHLARPLSAGPSDKLRSLLGRPVANRFGDFGPPKDTKSSTSVRSPLTNMTSLPGAETKTTDVDCLHAIKLKSPIIEVPQDPEIAVSSLPTVDLINPKVGLRSIDSSSSNRTVQSRRSSHGDDLTKDISPATAVSEISDTDNGNYQQISTLRTVGSINSAATVPCQLGLLSPGLWPLGEISNASQSLTARSPTSNIDSDPACCIPPVRSTCPSSLMLSPAPDTPADHGPQYSCSDCALKFRTPGLRKNHQNRKHNLRYSCSLCNARFGLRADLQRHERTVHKNESHEGLSRVFRCPNVGCTTLGKDYLRKDNFMRHVERCEKAIAKVEARNAKMEDVAHGTSPPECWRCREL